MNAPTPTMSLEEFRSLLRPPNEVRKRRRAAEDRRMRICLRLAQLIDAIAEQHPPGMSLRELAASLPPGEATLLLELVDRLDHESRAYGEVR